jgi:hypothetical protein
MTPKTKSPDVTNVHLDFNSPKRYALCWECEGFRFHRWYSLPNNPDDNTVYKNPPLKTEYKGAGYFDTRRLSAESAPTRAMLVAAMAVVIRDGLIENALANEEKKRLALLEQERLERIEHYKRMAGPALYDALKGFRDEYADRDTWPDDMVSLLENADAVLKLAVEGPEGGR